MSKSKLENKSDFSEYLKFDIDKKSSTLFFFKVVVSKKVVEKVKDHATGIYKNKIKTAGFNTGNLPDSYINKNCLDEIMDSCRKYILKSFVLNFLDKKIKESGAICASYPKLLDIENKDNGEIEFTFKASMISNILKEDNWHEIHFLPPKRKLYKDLDKQADIFIQEAEKIKILEKEDQVVEGQDWICFETSPLLTTNKKNFFDNAVNRYWFNINTKYITSSIHKIFLGKKIDESFTLDHLPIFGLPGDLISIKGSFNATVKHIVKKNGFSLDLFKNFFQLKENKKIHEKLIEIFSFRSDLSLRRLIIEEAFRVLFSRIKFEVPRYMILRKQETLLAGVRTLPDYNVYKMDPNFEKKISLLSEKQIKEDILVQYMSADQKINIVADDVIEYLNLFNHSRLSEFIYFKPSAEIIGDISLPIRESYFNLFVIKEKVLNFLIRKLSD